MRCFYINILSQPFAPNLGNSSSHCRLEHISSEVCFLGAVSCALSPSWTPVNAPQNFCFKKRSRVSPWGLTATPRWQSPHIRIYQINKMHQDAIWLKGLTWAHLNQEETCYGCMMANPASNKTRIE